MKKGLALFCLMLLLIIISTSNAYADFCLQIASYKSKTKAQESVNTLKSRDYNAFVQETSIPGKGRWYRVCFGHFATRSKAINKRKKLLANGLAPDLLIVETPTKDIPSSATADKIKTEPAGFTLHLASYRTKNEADKKVEDLLKQGHNAFLQKILLPGKGVWYRVYTGQFADKADALEHKRVMRSNGFGGYIHVVRKHLEGTDTLKTTENKANGLSKDEGIQTPGHSPFKSIQAKSDSVNQKAVAPHPGSRNITLKWDAAKGPDPGGYMIYYDTNPGAPYNPDNSDYIDEGPPPVIIAGRSVTQITLHGLTAGKDYYFAVTAFDSKGQESDFSTEIPVLSKTTNQSLTSPDTYVSGGEQSDTGPSSSGSTQTPSTPHTPLETASLPVVLTDLPDAEASQLIMPGDSLEIMVPGQRDMSGMFDVDPGGNIYLIMIGKLEVEGQSPAGLNEKLTKILANYMDQEGTVAVRIIEKRRYINIKGGIRYPGWYRVPNLTTLEHLIEMAGGLLPGAKAIGAALIRGISEKPEETKEYTVAGEISLNPNDILKLPFPEKYKETIDAGDLLFINLPQRQAPGRIPSATDSTDISLRIEWNQVVVDNAGIISIPDYGQFHVDGLTPKEVKDLISTRLPKYISRLSKVEVSIIEKKHFVQVLGHVNNPDRYNLPETANVPAAISAAGGTLDGALMSGVFVQRKVGDNIEKIKINLHQYNITGDLRLLTPPHENDVIFAPISDNFGNVKRTLLPWHPPAERLEEDVKNKVRIFGAVNNPGIYVADENMNILDLLVLASGETPDADLSKILIIRNREVVTEFNLRQFLDSMPNIGSQEPPPIYAGDTVYVKFVAKTIYEPEEDKVIYVFGNVKRQAPPEDGYELNDEMTVIQALALAGGLNEWADSDNIMIIRRVNGRQENVRYNFTKGLLGKHPEVDIILQTNDTIFVP